MMRFRLAVIEAARAAHEDEAGVSRVVREAERLGDARGRSERDVYSMACARDVRAGIIDVSREELDAAAAASGRKPGTVLARLSTSDGTTAGRVLIQVLNTLSAEDRAGAVAHEVGHWLLRAWQHDPDIELGCDVFAYVFLATQRIVQFDPPSLAVAGESFLGPPRPVVSDSMRMRLALAFARRSDLPRPMDRVDLQHRRRRSCRWSPSGTATTPLALGRRVEGSYCEELSRAGVPTRGSREQR